MNKNIRVEKIITITKEVNLHIDGVTLLSVDEYRKMRSYIKPTHFAWWLRSPGKYHDHAAAVVNADDFFDREVNVKFYHSVRPALKINIKSLDFQVGDSFQLGKYTWTVISEDYALCDTRIDSIAFRYDWYSQDANDYEKSDVKKFLDKWYISQILQKNNCLGC